MQPKKYNQPKIVLLNVELELKAEKENAELRIENVQVSSGMQGFIENTRPRPIPLLLT